LTKEMKGLLCEEFTGGGLFSTDEAPGDCA
jgi:hypothetical protein